MEQTQHTALLVMDMQMGILSMLADTTHLVSHVSEAIAAARRSNIPVIYVVVGFRQGAPEVNVNNKSFAASRDKFAKLDMAAFMQIHPDLMPQEGELIVTKRRVSAFTGSDLEVVLRSFDIRHIVLSGISTSGVVLSTLREAADKDYRITLLSDACADGDEEVHRILTAKVFPRQADVMTVDQWSKI